MDEFTNTSRADMERYLAVHRAAVRYRNPETGRRHFCHEPTFRWAFVRRVKELRARCGRPKDEHADPARDPLAHNHKNGLLFARSTQMPGVPVTTTS